MPSGRTAAELLRGLGYSRAGSLGLEGLTPRLPDPVSLQPSSHCHTGILQYVPATVTSLPGFERSHRSHDLQGSHRTIRPETRFLQPNVRGAQGDWRLETDHRFEPPEQDDSVDKISYGDTTTGSGSCQPGGLDGVDRSQGRLFPGTHTPKISQVPQICVGPDRLSVPCLMFRVVHSAPGVYQNHVQRSHLMPQTGHTATQVPRRLADCGRVSPGSRVSQRPDTTVSRTPGPFNQLGEVRPSPHTEAYLPRNRHRHHPGQSLPLGAKNRKTDRNNPPLQRVREPPSVGMAEANRSLSITREIGSVGSLSSQVHTIPTTEELVPSQRRQEQTSPDISRCAPRPDLVGGSTTSFNRHTAPATSSGYPAVHRCLHPGLGSTPIRSRSIRFMVPRTNFSSHKLSRTTGSETRIRILPRVLSGQDHSSDVRQRHSGLEHQETRRNQILGPVLPDLRITPLGQRTENNPTVKIYSREEKCSGRSTEQEKADPPSRVVPTQRHLQGPMETLGSSPCRPVCHKQEPSTPVILFSSPRPTSLVNRRSGDPLGQSVGLRLSTAIPHHPGDSEDKPCVPVLHDTDRTKMATTTVVRRSPPPAGRPSKRAPPVEDTTKTTSSRSLSQESRNVQLTRLEAIQSALRKKGFSRKAARRISQPTRKSTTELYQAKWAQFCNWSRSQSLNPLKATVPVIVDFLLFLREEKKLSSSAIKGYRSALAPVFLHRGLDISSSPEISALLKNFDQEIVKTIAPTPKWDLNLVLQNLTRQPYEPISSCSLKALTHKTVFLLALASAKRVSELHGLSYVVSWSQDKSSATLRLCPEFIAKTQIPGDPSTSYDPITIPALTKLVNKEDDEYLLCPLRALRTYLSKTSAARPTCTRLLMSTTSTVNHKPVSKNTISFWIRSVIKDAYREIPQSDLQLWKVSAHEVRAIATSLLFKQNTSVREVMNAASWRARSTFVAFYLRDLGHRYLDVSSLGPFVAAQAVIQNTRTDNSTRTSTGPSSKKNRGGAAPASSSRDFR